MLRVISLASKTQFQFSSSNKPFLEKDKAFFQFKFFTGNAYGTKRSLRNFLHCETKFKHRRSRTLSDLAVEIRDKADGLKVLKTFEP